MKKVLLTFAEGFHKKFQAITAPRMLEYSLRHGMDFVAANNRLVTGIPYSWQKIPVMIKMFTLEEVDWILWLDSDVYISKLDICINDTIPMLCNGITNLTTVHRTAEHGDVPNCGVWLLHKRSLPVLYKILYLYEIYKDHCWWEQGGFIEKLKEKIQEVLSVWFYRYADFSTKRCGCRNHCQRVWA